MTDEQVQAMLNDVAIIEKLADRQDIYILCIHLKALAADRQQLLAAVRDALAALRDDIVWKAEDILAAVLEVEGGAL